MLQKEADEKLELELRQQMLEAQGKTSKEIMMDSLDEFGKLDEFSEMSNIVGGMLAKAADNQAETAKGAELRQARIQKEMEAVSAKYGRVMTPSTTKSSFGRKAESLHPEQL